MSTYTERANVANAANVRLTENVEHAERIAGARDTRAVADALTQLLDHRVPHLDETARAEVVEAFIDPIAFACSKSRDAGFRYGDLSRRQSIANQLGLGKLEE